MRKNVALDGEMDENLLNETNEIPENVGKMWKLNEKCIKSFSVQK